LSGFNGSFRVSGLLSFIDRITPPRGNAFALMRGRSVGPLLPSLLLAAVLGGDPPGPLAVLVRLRPGTPAAEAVQLLGKPQRVARQVLYRRCVEQWIYETPVALRIEVDCVHGRPSQILTVHPIRSTGP
jgi:hypothetical protein